MEAVIDASAERLLARTTAYPDSAVRCPYLPDGMRIGVPLWPGARLLHSQIANHCVARHPRYPQGAWDRRPCTGFETFPLDVATINGTARRVSAAPTAVAGLSSGHVATTAGVIRVDQGPSPRQDKISLHSADIRVAGRCQPGPRGHRPTLAEVGPHRLRPSNTRLSV